jgi:fatty acid synthase
MEPTLRTFVDELKAEGVFAREVKSSGVAFHSYFMASIAPQFKKSLEGVIPTPVVRSGKWISSSIPEER